MKVFVCVDSVSSILLTLYAIGNRFQTLNCFFSYRKCQGRSEVRAAQQVPPYLPLHFSHCHLCHLLVCFEADGYSKSHT